MSRLLKTLRGNSSSKTNNDSSTTTRQIQTRRCSSNSTNGSIAESRLSVPICNESRPVLHSSPDVDQQHMRNEVIQDGVDGADADQEDVELEMTDIMKRVGRGGSRLPDAPDNEDAKTVLIPIGDTMWMEESVGTTSRMPNGIIGCIIRDRYPGALLIADPGTNGSCGQLVPATNWKHYKAFKDPLSQFETLLDRVEADFWAHYKCKEGHEDHAKRVLLNVIKKQIPQMIYWARIQSILDYYHKDLKISLEEEEAYSIYLSKEQYMKRRPYWVQLKPTAWELLATKWASEQWIKKSMEGREKRKRNREPCHRQGSCSLIRLCQKKGKKEGREVLPIEGYMYGHRSKKGTESEVLCNKNATTKLALYKDAFQKKHGSDSEWMKQPIDGSVLYQACGGKPHGRFPICDGLISTPSVVSNARVESYSVEIIQQTGDRFEREINERINKTVEDRLSQVEEQNRVLNNQMQQQMSNQVLAVVNATNEYWMKYLQSITQMNTTGIQQIILPPPPPFCMPTQQPAQQGTSGSEVARHEPSKGDSAAVGTNEDGGTNEGDSANGK